MIKVKIAILCSFIFILSGCYSVNQKVTKLTAAKDIITAMKQDNYITNYDSIESVEINERVPIEKKMEIFIQHAFLIKGREVEIQENENSTVEKQDQLLLLYAVHTNERTAVDIWASFDLYVQRNWNSTNSSLYINMCDIKPGLFCKFRQSPYTMKIADIELDQEYIDRLTKEKTEFEVVFEYITEQYSLELFSKKFNGGGNTKTGKKKLSVDFSK